MLVTGETAGMLLAIGRGWLIAGGVVGAIFLIWGIDRVEPNARGAYSFRPLLVPGLLLLWPLVLWRWWRLARGHDPGGARHAPPRPLQHWLALAMAAAVPAVLAIGLVARQDGPGEAPAVLLIPPGERP